MNSRRFLSLPAALLGVALGLGWVSSASAYGDVAISAEIRLGRALPPPPPEVVVIENVAPPGPPPWAPAHGLRRNRVYYYYPASGVYFRPADRAWFYLEGGSWRLGVALPDSVAIDFGYSVRLTMETDRPYDYHSHVVTYYPQVYFGTRVRLKGEPVPSRAGPPEVTSSGAPDHAGKPGRGPGEGRGRGGKPDKHR